jgi:ArsR family transcriptional regulator
MTALTPLQLFKHLSEETRLSITLLLRAKSELCVCELTAVLDRPQPKVSRHLAMLREGGLLQDRREGKWIYYRLSPHMPAWAAAVIEQAWQSQGHEMLERLKRIEASGSMTLCQ